MILKSSYSWKSDNLADIFVFSRQLPYINQPMMYVPELSIDDVDVVDRLAAFAKTKKPMFLRLEISNTADCEKAEAIKQKLKENGFIKAFEELQPEHRQIIDLTQSEEEILHNMKEKGRYNTRLAQKKGVRVAITKGDDIAASEKLKIVFDLYQKTAERKAISGRNFSYFVKLLENFREEIVIAIAYTDNITSEPDANLSPSNIFGAGSAKQSVNNIPLTGSLTILHNGVASYLYGGSSLEHKELMAPYLLHYEIMKYAKAKGCQTYDLLAIAPPDEPNHKFANLTRFKQQFGGTSIALIGSYDLVLKPLWYRIFRILENIRRT